MPDKNPDVFYVTWVDLSSNSAVVHTSYLLLSRNMTVKQLLYYLASEMDVDIDTMRLSLELNSDFEFTS